MYNIIKLLLAFGITWLARRILGWLISRIIMPSQYVNKPDCPKVLKEREQKKHEGVNVKYEFVRSADGALIDTIEISHLQANQQSPHIIVFGGNYYSYDKMLKDLKEMATVNKWKVIAFDYPHVRNSKGAAYSEIALMNAGIAQVERLLKLGVKDKDIKVYGTSLGGAIATLVADYYHNPEKYSKKTSQFVLLDFLYRTFVPNQRLQYLPEPHKEPKRIYLMNDRSFACAKDMSVVWYGKTLTKYIFKPILYLIHWEMNAAVAFRAIPDKYKLLFVAKKDTVIPYETASLYKKVKPDLKERFKNTEDLYKAYTYSVKITPQPQSKSLEELHWLPITMLKDKLDCDLTETVKLFINEGLNNDVLAKQSQKIKGKTTNV